jgi:transcriptional regulator with XRE-family HTH domain
LKKNKIGPSGRGNLVPVGPKLITEREVALKNKSNLSAFLKKKRVEAGLTQSEVAQELGYSSPQFISNWERGLANPPVFILRNLTKLYKVSADEMFTKLMAEVERDLHREFYSSKSARRRN